MSKVDATLTFSISNVALKLAINETKRRKTKKLNIFLHPFKITKRREFFKKIVLKWQRKLVLSNKLCFNSNGNAQGHGALVLGV